eukprot:scpid66608/ scgid29658/ 
MASRCSHLLALCLLASSVCSLPNPEDLALHPRHLQTPEDSVPENITGQIERDVDSESDWLTSPQTHFLEAEDDGGIEYLDINRINLLEDDCTQCALDCDNIIDLSLPLPCSSTRLGRTRDCPATSCRTILQVNPTVEDGIYYLHVQDITERDLIFPAFCLMSQGGFTMVSKIPTGTKAVSADDVWLDRAEINEGYRRLLQLGHPVDVPVMPYKNRLVRHWTSENDWTEAKVALIKNGLIAQYLDFNITGSSALDTQWFTKSKLLRSSWTDLSANTFTFFFDITAFRNRFGIHRTFYISGENAALCGPHNAEQGWMVAIGEDFECAWERPVDTQGLRWIYSTGQTKARFSDEIGTTVDVADSMVVLLR